MRDFYASVPAPLDQAHGLRQLFAAARQRLVPLVANPHVAFSGVVIDQLTAAFVARGQRVLIVDAADAAPQPHELALLDLGAAIEDLSPQIGYLAARGLPLRHVDTRGSAAGFVDAIAQAAPKADVVLLHANANDLARMLAGRALRPVLLAADHLESVKHAYAACKLLAQRCELMTFDLALAADVVEDHEVAVLDPPDRLPRVVHAAERLHRLFFLPAAVRPAHRLRHRLVDRVHRVTPRSRRGAAP